MFHAELRRFPRVTYAFNLSESELNARILDAWRAGRPIELGDHRWMPDQAKLRILEGPQLAANELSMGRGWAAAQRRASDVTERLLAAAPAPVPVSGSDRALAGELLAQAAATPLRLHELWEFVHQRRPQWRASDCLAAAERALGVLLGEGLASLQPGEPDSESSLAATSSGVEPRGGRRAGARPGVWAAAGPTLAATDRWPRGAASSGR